MKRIILCFMCFASLWLSIPTVTAQESHSVEQSSEIEHSMLTQDSELSAIETFAVNETNEEINGVYGTVPWTFDEETGTLSFGGGEFPETNAEDIIYSTIEENSLLNGQCISKIIFTEPIKAHSDSSYLFFNLRDLQTIENIDCLDTSDVTNMTQIFSGTSSLTNLDLSNWNTSNVTSMDWAFSYDSSLTSLDISNWDTSNVLYMEAMFEQANNLDTLKLGTKTVFKSYTFLSEKNDSTYTGAWKLQNGTNRYGSSEEFVADYDGTYPGTYVRERVAQDIKVTGIELLPTTLSLTVGQEQVAQTQISPMDATNQTVTYTSSDSSIATVDALGKVTAIKAGTATITATTEDGGLTATTQVTVKDNILRLVSPDIFYLGIDQYVTGFVDTSLNARKAQLLVNGTIVDTVNLFSDGSFELASNGAITQSTDVVEVIVLDKKNGVLDQGTVTIKEQNYSLIVNP